MPQQKWKDAVISVLQEAKRAMHYAEIAQEIQRQGLRTDFGATPNNTVYATIGKVMKDGDAGAQIVKVGMGEFMWRQSEGPKQIREEETPSESERGLIKALGMYWRRTWVEWVTKPKLLGTQTEGAVQVDFAEQLAVYLLHDGREVVYVGRASDNRLGGRLGEHTRDRLNGRWDRFSWFGMRHVDDKGQLGPITQIETFTAESLIGTLEALLIEGLEPRQNRRRGDDFQAVEYLQVEDPLILKKRKTSLAKEMAEAVETR
jgi:hypothetical protein